MLPQLRFLLTLALDGVADGRHGSSGLGRPAPGSVDAVHDQATRFDLNRSLTHATLHFVRRLQRGLTLTFQGLLGFTNSCLDGQQRIGGFSAAI